MDIILLSERVRIVRDTLTILEGQHNDPDCDVEDRCIDLFTELKTIELGYSNLRNTVAKITEEVAKMMTHVQKLKQLRKHIEHIKNFIPVEPVEPKRLFMEDTAQSEQTVSYLISPVPKSWASLQSPIPVKQSSVSNPAPPQAVAARIKFIASVSETDFNTVPKYMKGRLALVHVNRLIDALNATLKKKYETLAKNKKSLKLRDLEFYSEWKRAETMEPKGTYFVTNTDVNEFGCKLDKTSLNMLAILRHLQRIREKRVSRDLILYIVV